jgi:hypothetical protein
LTKSSFFLCLRPGRNEIHACIKTATPFNKLPREKVPLYIRSYKETTLTHSKAAWLNRYFTLRKGKIVVVRFCRNRLNIIYGF